MNELYYIISAGSVLIFAGVFFKFLSIRKCIMLVLIIFSIITPRYSLKTYKIQRADTIVPGPKSIYPLDLHLNNNRIIETEKGSRLIELVIFRPISLSLNVPADGYLSFSALWSEKPTVKQSKVDPFYILKITLSDELQRSRTVVDIPFTRQEALPDKPIIIDLKEYYGQRINMGIGFYLTGPQNLLTSVHTIGHDPVLISYPELKSNQDKEAMIKGILERI